MINIENQILRSVVDENQQVYSQDILWIIQREIVLQNFLQKISPNMFSGKIVFHNYFSNVIRLHFNYLLKTYEKYIRIANARIRSVSKSIAMFILGFKSTAVVYNHAYFYCLFNVVFFLSLWVNFYYLIIPHIKLLIHNRNSSDSNFLFYRLFRKISYWSETISHFNHRNILLFFDHWYSFKML